jgi:hypothetical protein
MANSRAENEWDARMKEVGDEPTLPLGFTHTKIRVDQLVKSGMDKDRAERLVSLNDSMRGAWTAKNQEEISRLTEEMEKFREEGQQLHK